MSLRLNPYRQRDIFFCSARRIDAARHLDALQRRNGMPMLAHEDNRRDRSDGDEAFVGLLVKRRLVDLHVIADHAGHRGERKRTSVSAGIEYWFLVFLHVLAIGERETFHHHEQRCVECAEQTSLLWRGISSAASGLRFCGMIELPVVKASDSLMKPKAGLAQMTISSARRDRCMPQNGGGG